MSMLLCLGYNLGWGLGSRLYGITQPIQPRSQTTTFGLGYNYIVQEYHDWTPSWGGFYYPLPKLILPLYQTFHKAKTIWGSKKDVILEKVRNLFLTEDEEECNLVLSEEVEDNIIQIMEDGAVLGNGTAKPSRACQEPGQLLVDQHISTFLAFIFNTFSIFI